MLKQVKIIESKMDKKSLNVDEINSNTPRAIEEWVRIFKGWSEGMDDIYGKPSDKNNGPDFSKPRNNAEMWDKGSPADWMEPFNDVVFKAWAEHDGGDPMWKTDFMKGEPQLIKSSSLENIKAIEDNLNTKDVNGFLQKLGIDINSIEDNGKFNPLFQTTIEPETCGLASLLFKTLELKVKGGKEGETIHIIFDYEYTHPGGGSNGKSITALSYDNGQTWTL